MRSLVLFTGRKWRRAVVERKRAVRAISRMRAALRRLKAENSALQFNACSMRDVIANAQWRERHLLAEYYELKGVDFDEIEAIHARLH